MLRCIIIPARPVTVFTRTGLLLSTHLYDTETGFMHLDRLPPGDNPPDNVNVMIEVPVRSDPIKYEMDKDSGALFVDRILGTAMHYPVNYGFIPNTLSGDGDPVDVMVLCDIPIQSGALIKVRPIGVMMMTDDGGEDEKILAVPVRKISSLY